jgi:Tetratricopeptide repeat
VLASVRELFAAGQHAGVVAVCTEALDRGPFDVALLLERARAWAALRRPDQAQADLREALRLDPGHGGAYCMLGQQLVSNGKLTAAREAFRRAIEVSGGDATARQHYFEVEARLAARLLRDRAATERYNRGRERRGQTAGEAVPERIDASEGTATRPTREPVAPVGEVAGEPTRRILRDRSSSRSIGESRARGAGTATVMPAGRGREAPVAPIAAGNHGPRAPRARSLRAATAPWVHPEAAAPTRPSSPALHRAATAPHVRRGELAEAAAPEACQWETTRPILVARRAPSPVGAGPASEPQRAGDATPEVAGFADYLLRSGVLTVERLRAALAYQESVGGTLAAAVIALGLASPQHMESAMSSHRTSRQHS